MKTISVIAVAGLKVPMEDKSRSYIGDAEALTVPDTIYYQRRISDGDLQIVPDAQVAPTESTAGGSDTTAADSKKTRITKTTGE